MSKESDEYSLLANIYDPATAWALDPLRREIAEVAVAAGADRALDVCCGTGRQCLFLAQAGIHPTGLDLSPAMLARATLQDKRPTLVLGDAVRLPFTDGAFPFTSVALALHEKPPQARPDILAEMLRVTAPGGLVAVVDYLTPETLGQALLGVGIKAIERLAGREHHAYYSDFMKGGGLEGFLRSQSPIPYEIRRSFLGLIGMALVSQPG
jgi:ubiquinone/menaquinone biosynthesis C-methylase UbiE